MEAAIEAAEQAVIAADAAAADPAIAADHVALSARLRSLTDAQAEVERLYARWAELEAKQKG
jgi:ATP-binding cassette subfamily F protein uup